MRKRLYPHPAAVYLILLLAVILVSWAGSIIEIRNADSYSSLIIRSILSAGGMRWMVSNAPVSLQHAPIGNAVMLFMTAGVLKASGLWSAFSRIRRLAPKENASLVVALVSLLLLALLFFMSAVSGSRLATGLAAGFSDSPLVRGFIFMLMITASVPSVAYGLACGAFQSAQDCVEAFACMIRPMAHFLICMLIASQLLDAFSYSRLDRFLGLGQQTMKIIAFILYWLPLPIIMRRNQKTQSNI